MKKRDRPTVAVLDFSGVLSLGAVAFGRRQNLKQALLDSGLAALGLEPTAFWDEIINPTWHEGSTTARGYQRLLGEATLRLAASRGKNPAPETVFTAAARFTAAYLRHSTIEPHWASVLCRLSRQKVVVIATDNYAEATAHIVQQLADLGLAAAPALTPPTGKILVANSADLGAPKKSAAFWKPLLHHWQSAAPASALLVDDFGCNEQPGDSYALPENYLTRKENTVAAIESSWGTPVRVFPFLLQQRNERFSTLINAAAKFLLE